MRFQQDAILEVPQPDGVPQWTNFGRHSLVEILQQSDAVQEIACQGHDSDVAIHQFGFQPPQQLPQAWLRRMLLMNHDIPTQPLKSERCSTSNCLFESPASM
ncbi:hypothetical protein N7466_007033 [Penicillium verhagenii]|uniref:uncharacterized protein n=1 Tax=Penicillium verhagenii TaxID=1562060 RepID=UPI00254518B5|nr:uncharacterized protein N7466_007033 [Penicillium verhagenii]KAJ5928077.1 hypothetical protein N7466_007033 [Penicillium verhagenii]